MLTTNNYGFNKPELTDPADITVTNPNWDILDEELAKNYKIYDTLACSSDTDLDNHLSTIYSTMVNNEVRHFALDCFATCSFAGSHWLATMYKADNFAMLEMRSPEENKTMRRVRNPGGWMAWETAPKSSDITPIAISHIDLTAGETPLATGTVYLVYE